MRHKHWIGAGASIILGLIFVAAGLGKLLDPVAIRDMLYIFFPSFGSLFLTSAFTKAILIWLPRIELIVGLILIIGIAAKLMAIFSSVLIAGFIANNSWMISQGLGYKPCGCLPIVERITQTQLSNVGALYLDTGMLALVLIILFCYRGNFLNIHPWFLARGKIAGKKNRVGSG